MKCIRWLVVSGLLLSPIAAAEESSSPDVDSWFGVSTGFEYSSGKYGGATSTDILYVPVTARYGRESCSMSITIPYIRVSSFSSDVVVRGMGRMKNTTSIKKQNTQSGLGDVMAVFSYAAITRESVEVSLSAGVKFGTADAAKGLGTGVNDYSAMLDGAYLLGDTVLVASAGYKFIGKPARTTLRDIGFGSMGAKQQLGEKGWATLLLDVAQAGSAESPVRRVLTLGWMQQADDVRSWGVSLARGYTSATADWALNASLSTAW